MSNHFAISVLANKNENVFVVFIPKRTASRGRLSQNEGHNTSSRKGGEELEHMKDADKN